MGNVHLRKKKTPTKQENALNPAVVALQFNRAPALFRYAVLKVATNENRQMSVKHGQVA